MISPFGKTHPFKIALAVIGIVLALWFAYRIGANQGGPPAPVVSGKPGDAVTAGAVKKKEVWSCPMHPAIVSDKAGICPICHMDLQKVDDDEGEGESGHGGHSGHGEAAPSDSVSGRAGFRLSNEKQQLIGVAVTEASFRTLENEVQATGKAAYDPDLFTAVEEYRQALQTGSQMKDSTFSALKEQSGGLVQSARTRLRLLGLSDSQISELSKPGADPMNLLLPAGSVWIYAEVYEFEIGGIKNGQKIEVSAPAVPGKVFSGKITSVSPIVNAPTRTIRVRALVPDPERVLRPDTFVNVRIHLNHGTRLAVPEDAVLHSGSQSFVFVKKGKGSFEPRAVVTGIKAGAWYEITRGLEDGETVVSSANFLIDSESRLRSVLQNMGGSK